MPVELSVRGASGEVVFEQCVRWNAAGVPTCEFAVRGSAGGPDEAPDGARSGEIKMQPMVEAGGVTYIPYPASIDRRYGVPVPELRKLAFDIPNTT